MLATPADEPILDQEWRDFLNQQDFGQVIAPGPNGQIPVVVPAHYCYDGDRTIELHLHRENPVWTAIRANDRVVFAVIDAHVYIPSTWNAEDPSAADWAPPTSYYAAVQAICSAVILDEPAGVAALLRRQMRRMQPEGGYASIEPGLTPYGRMLGGIRGLRLEIDEVRAKFKFGGNRSHQHRARVAERLAARGTEADLRARSHLLRRC